MKYIALFIDMLLCPKKAFASIRQTNHFLTALLLMICAFSLNFFLFPHSPAGVEGGLMILRRKPHFVYVMALASFLFPFFVAGILNGIMKLNKLSSSYQQVLCVLFFASLPQIVLFPLAFLFIYLKIKVLYFVSAWLTVAWVVALSIVGLSEVFLISKTKSVFFYALAHIIFIGLYVFVNILIGLFAWRGHRLHSTLDKVRIRAAEIEIKTTIPTALALYLMDTGSYPANEHGLKALLEKPQGVSSWSGPYIDKQPRDPWGHDYKYVFYEEAPQGFSVLSSGPDGALGSEDDIIFEKQTKPQGTVMLDAQAMEEILAGIEEAVNLDVFYLLDLEPMSSGGIRLHMLTPDVDNIYSLGKELGENGLFKEARISYVKKTPDGFEFELHFFLTDKSAQPDTRLKKLNELYDKLTVKEFSGR